MMTADWWEDGLSFKDIKVTYKPKIKEYLTMNVDVYNHLADGYYHLKMWDASGFPTLMDKQGQIYTPKNIDNFAEPSGRMKWGQCYIIQIENGYIFRVIYCTSTGKFYYDSE